MSLTLEDTLRTVSAFAAPFASAVERKLRQESETDDINLVDLIDLAEEVPKEACSARALLVYNLKLYNLNQEERRAFIDLVEWDGEFTLMQLPASELSVRLMQLRNKVGDYVNVHGINYPAYSNRLRRWIR